MLQPPGKRYILISHHELSALIHHIQAQRRLGCRCMPCTIQGCPKVGSENRKMPGREKRWQFWVSAISVIEIRAGLMGTCPECVQRQEGWESVGTWKCRITGKMNNLAREASLSQGLTCHPGDGIKKILMATEEMNGFLNLAILKWISKIPGFLARNWFLYTDSTCHTSYFHYGVFSCECYL